MAAHPGAVVATVTAGKPGPHTLTDWDRKCGFAEGDDAVGARRQEDEAALAILDARPVWFDYLDSQYAPVARPTEVARALEQLVRDTGADVVAMPLGLHHQDHLMTAAACREVARRTGGLTWYVYEDVIYRRLVHGRTVAGFTVHEAGVAPIDLRRKRQALERYTSQLRGLGDLWLDGLRPERYWMLDTSR